jgi:hypothetical protein
MRALRSETKGQAGTARTGRGHALQPAGGDPEGRHSDHPGSCPDGTDSQADNGGLTSLNVRGGRDGDDIKIVKRRVSAGRNTLVEQPRPGISARSRSTPTA